MINDAGRDQIGQLVSIQSENISEHRGTVFTKHRRRLVGGVFLRFQPLCGPHQRNGAQMRAFQFLHHLPRLHVRAFKGLRHRFHLPCGHTHLQACGHPVLAGIGSKAFRHWRDQRGAV
ncbi:hypothetical protein DK59_3084 [Brucella abortus bv. 4 str. 292]|nr:hypothetical protein DK59_3084 [Brucella abortus bv. 4 str. 292]